MKQDSKYTILLFIFITFFLIININVYAKVPILRVGIFLDCKEVTINGEKELHIYEISSQKILFIKENNRPLKITADTNGMKINNQLYESIKGIKIVSEDGGLIQIENWKYRGEIEIIADQKLLNVINVIEIEKYLYGVLKKEISPEWPEEVLRAQAIAARTFALANMNKFIEEGYNICATTNSQAYGGVNHEHPATNKAVNDTSGIVLIYQGEPINAVYHSDSGGYTENSEDVWGSYVPYLRSVCSDYEESVSPPNHCWDYSITEQEIVQKLTQQGFQLSSINKIGIGEKTEAGRVKSVDIFADNHQIFSLKTNDFRLLIGPTLIRSSLFSIDQPGDGTEESSQDKNNLATIEQEKKVQQKSVKDILKEEKDLSISELIGLLNRPKEPEPEKVILPEIKEKKDSGDLLFTFIGHGNGHGVGLSQWGAYGMAAQGYNYEDILKYYYQGIQLTKLY
jgi:stage II sporulation protein D